MARRFDLFRYSDEQTLADGVALRWLDELAQGPPQPQRVALSGGRITRRFFNSFVAQCRDRQQELDPIEFFWADERCVPPEHPESNFGMARQLLLAPLAIAQNRIHRIRGEIAPTEAAREAERELRRVTNTAGERVPILDLIFLGMGEDGHVASLFPERLAEAEAPGAVYRSVIASKAPAERVTITYQTIAAARQVWVIISGAGKGDAFRRSIAANADTPLGRVLELREGTLLLTDLSAVDTHG